MEPSEPERAAEAREALRSGESCKNAEEVKITKNMETVALVFQPHIHVIL